MSQNTSPSFTSCSIRRHVNNRLQSPTSDPVIVEEPLSIRVEGSDYIATMRTPGDDLNLAIGLLFHEGVIADYEDILDIAAFDERGRRWVDCRLAPGVARPAVTQARRINSACGLCGKVLIAERLQTAHPRASRSEVSLHRLIEITRGLKNHQPLFIQTGAAHCATLLDKTGRLLHTSEDVGRHNAVDKVIGWALRTDQAPPDTLLVSSRVSYEIVEKAVLFGLAQVAGLGAPTSLAIEFAQAVNMRLIGFLASKRPALYSGS